MMPCGVHAGVLVVAQRVMRFYHYIVLLALLVAATHWLARAPHVRQERTLQAWRRGGACSLRRRINA